MNPKVLEKIKKCMALSKSSNSHEAAAAMRQAQKLMEMHGVTTEDVVISDVESHIAPVNAGRIPPMHVAMLANMIADAFGAEIVYHPLHRRRRWIGRVEFYGLGGAAEIAGYAFEVLGRQLKRDRNAYLVTLSKRLKRATKVKRGDLYAQAWVDAVARHVVPHQRSEAEDQILAAYKARRWETPLEDIKPRDTNNGLRADDVGALYRGRADGSKVDFHQGVKGKHGAQQAAIERLP